MHAPVSCAGESDKPLIIIADDLSPSDTIKMDKSKIAGFVTQRGELQVMWLSLPGAWEFLHL